MTKRLKELPKEPILNPKDIQRTMTRKSKQKCTKKPHTWKHEINKTRTKKQQ